MSVAMKVAYLAVAMVDRKAESMAATMVDQKDEQLVGLLVGLMVVLKAD